MSFVKKNECPRGERSGFDRHSTPLLTRWSYHFWVLRTLNEKCVKPTRFQGIVVSGGSCGSKAKISRMPPPGTRTHPILQRGAGPSTPKKLRTRSGGVSATPTSGHPKTSE